MSTKLDLEPCLPPVWARSGHAQTIMGYFLPYAPMGSPPEIVLIRLPDGDHLLAHYYPGKSDTMVTLFHGLGGNIQQAYMQVIGKRCRDEGHSVLLVNLRGSGEGAGLAKNPYHAGSTDDMSAAIEWGREKHPQHRHIAIGFSLGACILLVLLGRDKDKALPDSAIAVNGAFDLEKTSRELGQGWNKLFYDLSFVMFLRKDVRSRIALGANDGQKLPFCTSVRSFDALYTAKEAGFPSREAYYRLCSPKSYLASIETPTFILSAKDDPIIDYRDYLKAKLPQSVQLHLEKHGGHLGYLSKKTPLGTNRWLEYAIAQALKVL